MTHTKTILATLTALIIWSSAYVFIRIGVTGYSPGALALFRYLISSILLIPLYIGIKNKTRPTLKQAAHIFIIGLIGIACYVTALNFGEITVSASISSFLIGMSPIVSLLWLRITTQEPISRKRWTGIGISVFGLFIIAASKYHADTLDWHIIFVLIAMVCGGFYNVAQKPLLTDFKPIELTSLTLWSATAALLVFLPQLIHEVPSMPLHITGSAIYLGVAVGFIGYTAWTIALNGTVPASKLVMAFYALPLLSTLFGWLILGEIPAALSIAGGCVAILGAFIAA